MTQRKEVIQLMKGIRIFRRNIISAIKSIFRNFSLSVASITCTTITLIIVAIAILVSANINNFTKNLEGTLTIIAYVDKEATEDEVSSIKSRLLEIKNIKSDELQYKDKETIKKETMKNTDENSSLYSIMNSWTEETNPLESEFIITVKDVEKLSETAESIKKIENITNVQYSESVVEKMVPVFDVITKVTIIIILGLIAVTIFLICNTIKLTIFARKNEIEIMRLVGISNFVIKLPFVIEGLFLGIIGSIIPIVITIWGYIITYDKLEGYLFTNFIKMLEPLPFTLFVSSILLIIGVVVGIVGSYTTVRKHLKI
ncbi:MAG: permease-like cell division protein FtsX [Candidatus Coprovivens sp.]